MMRHLPSPRAIATLLVAILAAVPARAQDSGIAGGDILSSVVDHACLELRDDLDGCENVVLTADPEAGTADVSI